MDRAEFAAKIDHTVLGPETTLADVHEVLDAASEYGMNACIPPCYVPEAVEYAPDVTVATVVGFPHGQHATEIKREEAAQAWKAGADEVDVVLNVGRLQAGEDDAVEHDIAEVVAGVPIPVKVIILNNGYLGMVRQWQELFFDTRYSFVELQNPDFITIAKGFGIQGHRCTHADDLDNSLDTLINTPGAYLLEVVVEKEGNIFPMMPSGAGVDDIRLE